MPQFCHPWKKDGRQYARPAHLPAGMNYRRDDTGANVKLTPTGGGVLMANKFDPVTRRCFRDAAGVPGQTLPSGGRFDARRGLRPGLISEPAEHQAQARTSPAVES